MNETSDPLQANATASPHRSAGLRLSIMMFLQYAVWGVWLPFMANYLQAPPQQGGLGFSGGQIGWILGLAGSIGAIAAPFIAGQIADRYMNAERALALLLLLGGIVKIVLAEQTSYAAWLWLSVIYSVLYMPTLALTNSIAFANLDDPERKFPPVRALGTIGWIVASVAFPLIWMKTDVHLVGYWPFLDGTALADGIPRIADAVTVAGVLSIIYALYSLMLPKTPPSKDVKNPLAFAEAFGMFLRLDLLLLTVIALLISMIHQCYFFRTGPYLENAIGFNVSDVPSVMAIGQISEIVVLAVLGLFLKKLGYKWVLVLGALSYALRYGIFAQVLASAQPSQAVVQAAMALHGLNYGFFFAGSFLYVEKVSPENIRHSAQTVFGIIILGLGPVVAGFYNQFFDRYTDAAGHQQYQQFWFTQAGIALVSMIILLLLFYPKKEKSDV
ncbi:MAG: MFS transporter [Phycisphaeraceae bacterium]|nr:MFS transporter [Phycisphaeraceae bacterium]